MRVPESVLAKRKQNEKIAAQRNIDKIERKKVRKVMTLIK